MVANMFNSFVARSTFCQGDSFTAKGLQRRRSMYKHITSVKTFKKTKLIEKLSPSKLLSQEEGSFVHLI